MTKRGNPSRGNPNRQPTKMAEEVRTNIIEAQADRKIPSVSASHRVPHTPQQPQAAGGSGQSLPNFVDAGGAYSGIEGDPIQLNGLVRFEDDPAPTILWEIVSGGTGTFLPSAAVEDPTFTPDQSGPYVLRLTGTGVPFGPLTDTADLTSEVFNPVTFIGSFDPFDLVVDTPISPRDVSIGYTGSGTPFVYSLTGTAWPAWVNLDVNTGIITGTPDTVETTTGHTVTATDTRTNTAVSNTFSIDVVASSVPVEFIGNIADLSLEVGVACLLYTSDAADERVRV